MTRNARRYAPFSVIGLELEYAIVDDAMRPACLVDAAFRALHGRPTSDVVRGPVGFSNELAAHVVEAKMIRPRADLARAEKDLVRGIRRLADVLDRRFAARLLPAGMHPFMRPDDTSLWRGGGRAVYDAYARVFDIRQHGWLNVQSCHVNLPIGRTDQDFVLLHNAAACVLPYLPAVAASSPIVEGRLGPALDNRLAFYCRNQSRIPELAGAVIPEFIASTTDYRTRILGGVYRALRAVRGTDRLRHEWANSRGAIVRFGRGALELRLLDVQECVRMDVAVACFARAAIRHVARGLESGRISLPEHSMLVWDLHRVVRDGRSARVAAKHLQYGSGRARDRAGDILQNLLDACMAEGSAVERRYLTLVGQRLARGSIAELLRLRMGRCCIGERVDPVAMHDAFGELMSALVDNRPWCG